VPLDEATSAIIKCLRRGQEEQAIAWAVELDESGYTAHLWRRLLISCCEDHGIAEPDLPQRIMALYHLSQTLAAKKDDRQRAYRLPLIQAVISLARAKKSRIVDHALLWAYNAPARVPEIGPEALDKHTRRGAKRGAGWTQFWEDGTLLINHETGELETAPALRDDYRPRAIETMGGGR
jgi:replication-associated recombination protein RarA